MTVDGIVGAVIKLVEFLYFAEPGKDPVQLLAREVQNIENLLLASL